MVALMASKAMKTAYIKCRGFYYKTHNIKTSSRMIFQLPVFAFAFLALPMLKVKHDFIVEASSHYFLI